MWNEHNLNKTIHSKDIDHNKVATIIGVTKTELDLHYKGLTTF